MAEANVYFEQPDFRIGDGVAMASVGKHAGTELLGATAYELQPGLRWADLHVHHANEELIVVLAGRPTLHTLDGARELAPGEVVACRRGRQGAHRLSNDADEVARVLIVSTAIFPDLVEYPEDGRVLALTEPPWSEAPYDDAKGRLLRVFEREQGTPVPPDA